MSNKSGIVVPGHDSLTYSSYLKVGELIDLQKVLSQPRQHDEMLFIVIHQVYELWFKLMLHEISAATESIDRNQLMAFSRTLIRLTKIEDLLLQQIDILETMTATDFNKFRNLLNPASGFQSYQFRLLEFRLGLKNRQYLKFFRGDEAVLRLLESALKEPSLYDHFLSYMARAGYPVPGEVINRDKTQSYPVDPRLTEIFVKIYQESDSKYDLYTTLENMIELDEKLRLWRYRHIAMVERMIGNRTGTGGSSGVKYLSSTLEAKLYPEIWDVRNWLGGSYGESR